MSREARLQRARELVNYWCTHVLAGTPMCVQCESRATIIANFSDSEVARAWEEAALFTRVCSTLEISAEEFKAKAAALREAGREKK